MSELPFIHRPDTLHEAESITELLQKRFGYADGEFVLEGKNIRGKCNIYDPKEMRAYLQGVIDTTTGRV